MVRVRIARVGRPRKNPFPIDREITKVIDREAKDTKADFDRTTRTWAKKPVFEIKVTGVGSREVFTKDKIYGYLDQGTRPHIIQAKRAKTLRFNTAGFRAKSRPNNVASYTGRKASPPTAYTQRVHHPGFPPRNYAKLIKAKSQKRFKKALDKVFAKFAGKE